jgi:hypothetical protein
MLSSRLLAALALALALLTGCGDSENSRAVVQGSVTYDGQPVDQGGIAFIPLGNDAGSQRVRATGHIVDGRYELDRRHGPFPGKYRVMITWRKKTGKGEQTVQALPPKYADTDKSELTRDVEPGSNTIDFDLKK